MMNSPQLWSRRNESRESPWFRDPVRTGLMAVELVATTLFMLAYFWLRGVRPDNVDESVERSLHLIRFEQQFGLFQEVRWQEAFIGHEALMSVANTIYAWGHYPIMLAIALWLVFFKGPAHFRFARNVVLLSGILGIITYYVLPTAPPRLMAPHGYDFGFVDTVHGAASSVGYFQPDPFVNDYAALPSFHFGWIALAAAIIWVNTESRILRVAGLAMPILMWWAVTVTGNHYFFDMVFGGVVVAVAWLIVSGIAQVSPSGPVATLVGAPPSAAKHHSPEDG